MLSIGFVVTPGFPFMSLAALSVFEFANLSAQQRHYDVQILSENGGPVSSTLGATVDTTAWSEARFDTLIIGGNTRFVPASPGLTGFVAATATTARRIASICTGVFVLAEAGLLDGRRVTTHWAFTTEFKARFPTMKMDENRIFIIDGPIWTAAGNSAGIDMTLAMLERDLGASLALAVAKLLVIDHRRAGGQSQHSALLDLAPKSDRIQDALTFARANLHRPLSVERLAQAARLSQRQFSRAFRAETGQSPGKAIENLRLEAARLMIEQSLHPVDFVAAETGFGDQERMRRAFLRSFGHPPQAIRRIAQARAATL